MSIHHEVTVHCDTCGFWEYGNARTTRQRRRAGWIIWQDEYFSWRHTCPNCAAAPSNQTDLDTLDADHPEGA